MTKLATTASILLCTLTAFADPPQATDISNDKVAITEGGLRKGQNNLRNQTVSTGDRASDAKFQIQTLQRKANAATSTLSHEQKAELFDLGSEILPFVAPYINEIAESCIKKLILTAPPPKPKQANAQNKPSLNFKLIRRLS